MGTGHPQNIFRNLLLHDVHYVIDGNASEQLFLIVHHCAGYQIVFFERHCNVGVRVEHVEGHWFAVHVLTDPITIWLG